MMAARAEEVSSVKISDHYFYPEPPLVKKHPITLSGNPWMLTLWQKKLKLTPKTMRAACVEVYDVKLSLCSLRSLFCLHSNWTIICDCVFFLQWLNQKSQVRTSERLNRRSWSLSRTFPRSPSWQHQPQRSTEVNIVDFQWPSRDTQAPWTPT